MACGGHGVTLKTITATVLVDGVQLTGTKTVDVVAPGGITHGQDLPPLSADAEPFLQVATGTLTEWTGSTTLSGTQVIENRSFTDKLIHIAAGANITLRNCLLRGPLGQTSYTIRSVVGGESKLNMERCLLIARTTSSLSPRCLTYWGDTSVRAYRCVFRGGIDSVYSNTSPNAGQFAAGDPLVANARTLFEECWFGDIQRVASSHSDGIQFDGGGYAVIRRCRIMGYSIPVGSDPLTTRVTNPATAGLASGPIIATQNSASPNQLVRIALRDSWFEGGNYTVDMAPSDGLPPQLMAATGCKWGTRHQFGPLRLPSGSTHTDNRWGQAGSTACCGTVAVGQLLPGSG